MRSSDLLRAAACGVLLMGAGAWAQPRVDDFRSDDLPRIVADDTLGSDVMLAEDLGSAFDGAESVFAESGDRVLFFQTPDGPGVLATGRASYDPKAGDTRAGLLARRLALTEATLEAKRRVAAAIGGLSLDGREEFASRLKTIDRRDSGRIELDREVADSVRSELSTLVRGAVIERITDDPIEGVIRVTVVASPQLRGSSLDAMGRVRAYRSLEDLFNEIADELELGLTPPSGGVVALVGSPSQRVWVGYASEPVGSDLDERSRSLIERASFRHARLHAERGLLVSMTGELIESEESLETSLRQRVRDADEAFSRLDAGYGRAAIDSLVLESRSESQTRARVDGTLPAGIEHESFLSPDGLWAHHIAWLVETGPEPRRQRDEVGPRSPEPAPEPVQPRVRMRHAGEPCDDTGQPGMRRIEAMGVGDSRRAAIEDALLIAVIQVNGGTLRAETEASTVLREAIDTMRAGLSSEPTIERLTSDRITASTSGLVSGFRIIDEGVSGETHEVVLCVDVPVFDPDRPRAQGPATIAVLPFTVGPMVQHADSAERLERELGAALNRRLLDAGPVRVLDRRFVEDVRRELEGTLRDAREGRSPTDELVKAGRRLGADFVVAGEIIAFDHEVRYRENRARRAEERLERLTVRIETRVINVATGEVVGAELFNQEWSTNELARLRWGGRTPDYPGLAADAASEALAPALARVVAGRVAQGQTRGPSGLDDRAIDAIVLSVGDQVVLERLDPTLDRGDVVQITENRRVTTRTGETITERFVVAEARVTGVSASGRTVLASIIAGDPGAVREGALCVRKAGR
ncbi:MAG: hypothetical protein EA423_09825 [Phycisphaerales bacterium]|nr:MAG: hypothetical protein EA423_09825 [Phycisphaerales bacterium]